MGTAWGAAPRSSYVKDQTSKEHLRSHLGDAAGGPGRQSVPRARGEGGRESAEGKEEADRAGEKGKTALAVRGARQPRWSLQKTRLHPSRPSGLRKCSGDWSGSEPTGGLPSPEGGAGLRLLLPAASARQAFFSLLPPRAKLQFPGGLARSGLEVGSLEVTRATGAGGVSSEPRGAGRSARGARGAGSRDAQDGREDTDAACWPAPTSTTGPALLSRPFWSRRTAAAARGCSGAVVHSDGGELDSTGSQRSRQASGPSILPPGTGGPEQWLRPRGPHKVT
ncbi:collagen alpha-1(I) chain-like [Equus przewalskii]|uniref:Collagen alpha-1(I) chain-like n=1 Tax=Equus przewalskii TaxID=9798 RepID=A0ABM4JI42_EQUPR